MSDDSSSAFAALIDRVNSGDQEAAAELVGEYERDIRRVIRFRLTDRALRRKLDSVDIYQSVVARLFLGLALGEFKFKSPGHFKKLLKTMAVNKLNDYIRRQRTEQRALDHQLPDDIGELAVACPDSTPSSIAARRELLQSVRDRFTPKELAIYEERAQGRSWNEAALRLGGTPNALRVCYARAIDRIARALGNSEDHDASSKRP